MIRLLVSLALLAVFIWFGATVNLGHRTLFGHIANIWSSEEATEMREDVKDKTKPVLDKAKDVVKNGLSGGDGDAGAPAAPPAQDAGTFAPL